MRHAVKESVVQSFDTLCSKLIVQRKALRREKVVMEAPLSPARIAKTGRKSRPGLEAAPSRPHLLLFTSNTQQTPA